MKKLFKNIITMTLATVMAGSFMIVSANENNPDNPENYLAGDVNGDGKVDIKDATQIQKILTNISTSGSLNYDAIDFNGDGRNNIQDAVDIQKKTVKKKYNYANNFYPVNYVTVKLMVVRWTLLCNIKKIIITVRIIIVYTTKLI